MTISRNLLEKYFGDDPRMVRAMEDTVNAAADSVNNVAATSAMNDASVVTLSSNDAFDNEYILVPGFGIILDINPGQVSIRVDTSAIVSTAAPVLKLSTIGNFASDSAAASGGVQIGQLYRNGSALMIRVT